MTDLIQKLSKYPLAKQKDILKRVKQDLCKESLYTYAKKICGYSELSPIAHAGTIEALECDTRRKLIVLPRGCFKSSLGSVAYPMWRLENNPNLRVMIDSELYSNSKNFLREIKAHYVSSNYTNLFGQREFEIWNEGEIQFANRSAVYKEPSIVCSGVGAQKTGQHYDLIIADDLSSPSNTKNPEVAETVINHFKYYQSILEPNGTIVVIATRYSELDVIQFILDNLLGVSADFLLNNKQGGLIGESLHNRTS